MSNNYPSKLAHALRLAYEREKKQGGGWREIAQHHFDDKIPAGTLNRIAKTNGRYLPAVPSHLELLLVPYSAWPMKALIKKQLVTKKSLQNKSRRNTPKSIQDMSKKTLLDALNNRVEV